MKLKFLLLFFSAALLLSACSTDTTDYKSPVTFYYILNDPEIGTAEGVIKATTREADGHRDDYAHLIALYLNGPITYDCVSPFPAGTTLEELHWDQNRVQVILSPQITTLNGVNLTIACACLTRTVADITGIDTVQVRSSVGLLNGEQVLTFTTDSFLYQDSAAPSNSSN